MPLGGMTDVQLQHVVENIHTLTADGFFKDKIL